MARRGTIMPTVRWGGAGVVLALAVGAGLGAPAAASAWFGGPGVFACSAQAENELIQDHEGFDVSTTTPGLASDPCVTAAHRVTSAHVVSTGGCGAFGVCIDTFVPFDGREATESMPGGVPGGHAEARAGPYTGPVVFTGAYSSADARCTTTSHPGQPAVYGSSTVVGLVLPSGERLTTSQPMTLRFPGGTVYLNRSIHGPGDRITQIALETTVNPGCICQMDARFAVASAGVDSCS